MNPQLLKGMIYESSRSIQDPNLSSNPNKTRRKSIHSMKRTTIKYRELSLTLRPI